MPKKGLEVPKYIPATSQKSMELNIAMSAMQSNSINSSVKSPKMKLFEDSIPSPDRVESVEPEIIKRLSHVNGEMI